jgi:hypothetical protein
MERDHFEDLGINGEILLKYNLVFWGHEWINQAQGGQIYNEKNESWWQQSSWVAMC